MGQITSKYMPQLVQMCAFVDICHDRFILEQAFPQRFKEIYVSLTLTSISSNNVVTCSTHGADNNKIVPVETNAQTGNGNIIYR